MDHNEIALLEQSAAQVMGWQVYSYSDPQTPDEIEGYGLFKPDGSWAAKCTTKSKALGRIPEFARDAVRILEALDWLTISSKPLFNRYAPVRFGENKWSIKETFSTSEGGFRFVAHGDTLGIAICRAIIEIGKSKTITNVR